MAGAIVPNDWDGQTYKCVTIEWPDSVRYRAILLGLLLAAASPEHWDGDTGSADDAAGAIDAAYRMTDLSECEGESVPAREIGEIAMFAGEIVPQNWLLCNGQTVLRSSDLGALLVADGMLYGDGDGETTVHLPNFKARAPIGPTLSFPLGGSGGATEHTLTAAEMPLHTHPPGPPGYNFFFWGSGGSGTRGSASGTRDVEVQTSTGTSGGGAPHNNMQPYLVIQFMIYAGGG